MKCNLQEMDSPIDTFNRVYLSNASSHSNVMLNTSTQCIKRAWSSLMIVEAALCTSCRLYAIQTSVMRKLASIIQIVSKILHLTFFFFFRTVSDLKDQLSKSFLHLQRFYKKTFQPCPAYPLLLNVLKKKLLDIICIHGTKWPWGK